MNQGQDDISAFNELDDTFEEGVQSEDGNGP